MEVTFDKTDEGAATLHSARSYLLDAFGDLEAQLLKIVRSEKKAITANQTTGLVAAFRKLGPTSMLAKENLAKRDKVADQIDRLLQIRADIVHSKMAVHSVDGFWEARFVNARYMNEENPLSRNLTYKQFEDLTRTVNVIGFELSQLNRKAIQASSPPPP